MRAKKERVPFSPWNCLSNERKMAVKRLRIILVLLSLCFLLSSCSTGIHMTENVSKEALPSHELKFAAPIGDAGLASTERMQVYYPSYDGISLSAIEQEFSFSLSRPQAEDIVRNMIAFSGSGRTDSLGGTVKLSLYGGQPVEVSRNTVTIQLGASALQLNRSRLYLIGQAFANTLCQLEHIEYVNLLVAGKAVGLDTANTLPMGSFTSTEERDINALYKQKLDRRAEQGESAVGKAFPANVTLYYPLCNLNALVCDSQTLTFHGQSILEMVEDILGRLALGLKSKHVDSPELPLLCDFLTVEPCLIESEEAGGTILQLDFAQNLLEMLEAYQVDEETSMASLCNSLCSFLPGLVGIRVKIDGSPVEKLEAPSELQERGTLYIKKISTIPVYDYVRLYFAGKDGKLIACDRPIAYRDCSNPRKLLLELAKGPQMGDSANGLQPIMKKNALTDTTLIGFSLQDSLLLVNFSPAFVNVGNDITGEKEKQLVYAMVNTLCSNSQIKSVGFYCGGKQFDGFSGEIYWIGRFFPLP